MSLLSSPPLIKMHTGDILLQLDVGDWRSHLSISSFLAMMGRYHPGVCVCDSLCVNESKTGQGLEGKLVPREPSEGIMRAFKLTGNGRWNELFLCYLSLFICLCLSYKLINFKCCLSSQMLPSMTFSAFCKVLCILFLFQTSWNIVTACHKTDFSLLGY